MVIPLLANQDLKPMLIEACNECSFYFLANLIKNLLAKVVTLSLPMFYKYLLSFAYFQPHISYTNTCIATEDTQVACPLSIQR